MMITKEGKEGSRVERKSRVERREGEKEEGTMIIMITLRITRFL